MTLNSPSMIFRNVTKKLMQYRIRHFYIIITLYGVHYIKIKKKKKQLIYYFSRKFRYFSTFSRIYAKNEYTQRGVSYVYGRGHIGNQDGRRQ